MKFGFGVPTQGSLATPSALKTLVAHGEHLGFSLLSVSDHIVIPRMINSHYPYSKSGNFDPSSDGACLEQLTLLAFLAGQTSKVRLLTSVMVLPYRNPVLAAKVLASIDVLSQGRLILGCGVGWMREEFETLDSPPFDHRGSVSNEYLQVFRDLWISPNPTFSGKYVQYADIAFAPKPTQINGPPIWVGGESPAALRRAGRLGDAWYPIGSNPQYPLYETAKLSDNINTVRRHAEQAGRNADDLSFAYSAGWNDHYTEQVLPDGSRLVLTGSADAVANDIHNFAKIGVTDMTLSFPGRTLEERMQRMSHFAAEVMPLVED
jgi:probable F420-dependent oxidoreductase